MQMNKWMARKAAIAVGVGAMTGVAAFAAPTVSNVQMEQLADRTVRVTYDLSDCEEAVITLAIATNGVELAGGEVANLSGDVNKAVTAGTGKQIIWRAVQSWPNHKTNYARAKVTAWTKEMLPQYLVIDLTKGKAATEANPMPATYYTCAEAVPGGVTHDRYKSTHMLMRRVDPTDDLGFAMGPNSGEIGAELPRDTQHTVKLTKPYYLAVYEFTQGQCNLLVDDAVAATAATPANVARYYLVHGTCTVWPYDQSKDSTDAGTKAGWLQKIRTRTNLPFDLPTEAQWEYACRAGTTGALNDGTWNLDSAATDANLDTLGLYAGNAGGATAAGEVGRYKPNAWGFYDMHGNVREFVFDRYAQYTSAEAIDPTRGAGSSNDGWRIARGGSFADAASVCRSADRSLSSLPPTNLDQWSTDTSAKKKTGVRFCIPFEAL